MTLLDKALTVFEADRYAVGTTGVRITKVEAHDVCCELMLDGRHRNARGVAMGGALFTLADFAAAVAANTDYLEDGGLQWVSLNASIHYLAPASGSCLTAHCVAVKHGRSTALYHTVVEDYVTRKCVATVDTTMVRV